jgi:tRNA G46 methylase TrmB
VAADYKAARKALARAYQALECPELTRPEGGGDGGQGEPEGEGEGGRQGEEGAEREGEGEEEGEGEGEGAHESSHYRGVTERSRSLFDRLRAQEASGECERVSKYLTLIGQINPPAAAAPAAAAAEAGPGADAAGANAEGPVSVSAPAPAATALLGHPRVVFWPPRGDAQATSGSLDAAAAAAAEARGPRPLDLQALFGNARETKLEVCCGHGEWLVTHALAEPRVNWLGLEMRFERVYQTWTKSVMHRAENVVVLGGLAHAVVRSLIPARSVSEVFVNYPDPPVWPGSKQRLVDAAFLELAHGALRDDGFLVLVTDDPGYAMSMVKELRQQRALFSSVFGAEPFSNVLPADYGSSYFDRFWKNGSRTKRFYLRYRKTTPEDVATQESAAAGAPTVAEPDGDSVDNEPAEPEQD